MTQENFLSNLERIQCDMSSGIAALGLAQELLEEKNGCSIHADTLYVTYVYFQSIQTELRDLIYTAYQTHNSHQKSPELLETSLILPV